ncbi:GNAT family N-acetyltransferase [Actinokineospora sp. UTMC 2448]|uniref:GNAT family N-acetyltransferase n=1 Tax=Actinokineospora sp. UTMC 2448 TaxID=2268449 RepID=UPI0021643125|nr:GNAT family N-acetyltransferase [Actinokineospora sp. UTMC 2448]UVS82580.1 ribosomal-protein-alanine acetyltransferase [Actinokineospora sp. UTMC 2448]
MTLIRRAAPDDVEGIAETHVLGWRHGYVGLLPQPVLDGLRPEQRVPRWALAVADADWPRRGALVADDGDGIAGFAHLRPTGDEDADPATTGEVASFYVRPDTWRRGVGSLLMAAALACFREAGFTTATLWVQEGNERAMAFYARCGFAPDGAAKPDVVGGLEIRDLRYRQALT